MPRFSFIKYFLKSFKIKKWLLFYEDKIDQTFQKKWLYFFPMVQQNRKWLNPCRCVLLNFKNAKEVKCMRENLFIGE